jgi:SagB-type dehydrogenase family enzyme
MVPGRLPLAHLSTLLQYGYGVTCSREGTDRPRSLRAVPSAGALYPLECFFHTSRTDGLLPGLYHYNPIQNHLRHLSERDDSDRIAEGLVQQDLASGASVLLFLTAVFERSVFKYGNRGYRFTLLEAGHVAQNINLVAQTLRLSYLNIGGYFDRHIDDFLGLDGITHSTIYVLAIGLGGNPSKACTG